MKGTKTLFSLSEDNLKNDIGIYLTLIEYANAVRSCRKLYSLFANPIKASLLLTHIEASDFEKAGNLIQLQPNLLFEQGEVTDHNKIYFKKITPFKYALWTSNWRMWELMVPYISDKNQALKQLQEIKQNGMALLKELISAVETYIANYNPWSLEKCQEYWRKEVGMAQRKLPAWLVFEYCRTDRPIYELPVPNDANQLPKVLWPDSQGLGVTMGYLRACKQCDYTAVTTDSAKRELDFLRALFSIIEEKLMDLEKKLKEQPSPQPMFI